MNDEFHVRGWIGYDWFKLVVAVILALLLLILGMTGGSAEPAAVVPTVAPAAATLVPTPVPTVVPVAPTEALPAPTEVPTIAPTPVPTVVPTEAPGVTVEAPAIDLPMGATAGEVTLTGRGTPGTTVEVLIDGVSAGKTVVGADGAWSLPVTLTAGDRTLVARVVDASGAELVAGEPGTLSVGAAAVAPATNGDLAIAVPAEGAQVEPGDVTVSGTGRPGSTIEVLNGDQLLGEATVGADGTWSLNVTLAPGTASIGVREKGTVDLVGKPVRVSVGAAAVETCTTLGVGCQAWVTREGGLRLRMRAGPGTDQAIVMLLPIGTQMEVIGGPQTGGGVTWWQIRTQGGREGWVAGSELRLQPD